MTPWNYAGPLRMWPAGSWNMKCPIDREVNNKARKRRIKAAIARALAVRTARYLRNQGKRSDRMLRQTP